MTARTEKAKTIRTVVEKLEGSLAQKSKIPNTHTKHKTTNVKIIITI